MGLTCRFAANLSGGVARLRLTTGITSHGHTVAHTVPGINCDGERWLQAAAKIDQLGETSAPARRPVFPEVAHRVGVQESNVLTPNWTLIYSQRTKGGHIIEQRRWSDPGPAAVPQSNRSVIPCFHDPTSDCG